MQPNTALGVAERQPSVASWVRSGERSGDDGFVKISPLEKSIEIFSVDVVLFSFSCLKIANPSSAYEVQELEPQVLRAPRPGPRPTAHQCHAT